MDTSMDEATKHCQIHLPPLITLSCQHCPYCPVNSVSGFIIRCIRKNLQDTGDTREGVHVLYWSLLPSLPTPHMYSVALPSQGHPSHVMWYSQFLLLQPTNKAAHLHATQTRAREGEGREGKEKEVEKRNTVKVIARMEWYTQFSCQRWYSAT